jgi:D-sedoheptulose 7-phosphate isomerase
VGRDGGYTAQVADACVIVPTINPQNVTPHAEAFQAVVWHLLVSHPALRAAQTKWESTPTVSGTTPRTAGRDRALAASRS